MAPAVRSSHARLRQLLSEEQRDLFDRVSQLVKENPGILDNRGAGQKDEKEGVPSDG